MFKVLVIAYYFPPKGLSGVQRTLKFVKYFPKYGWNPTVLTSGDAAYYAYDDSLLEDLNDERITIVRAGGRELNSYIPKKVVKIPREWLRKLLHYFSSLLFIPDNKKGWNRKALDEARKILRAEKHDAIFVTGPPFSSVLLAVKLKQEFGLPLVVDYRDLWFGNQFAVYPTPLHSLAIKRMEYAALKAADKVTVTNRRIKERLLDYYKFLTLNDVVILNHGFDPDDFTRAQAALPARITGKCVITYSGIFYDFITPKYFLKAFKQLTLERPDIASNIQLHFVGMLREENIELIKKLQLEPFVINHGYLPHIEAVKRLLLSDILWFMVGPTRNADTHSSGKMFEYFGSKKPVIACLPEGALKQMLQEYEASFITEPDDVSGIKNALLKCYELYRLGKLPVPPEEVVERYRRDLLTDVLVKELQFLVKVKV